MAEIFEDDILNEEEEIGQQEESTLPWTLMLVLATVLLLLAIVLGYMELKDFYGFMS
jgi:hypothetical protein